MKKIALLLTILCAGALKAMEPKKPQPGHSGLGMGYVPSEVQSIINTYKNVDDAILVIKAVSLRDEDLKRIVNEEFEFAKLIHVLADTFNLSTRAIAEKFETPGARLYINLGDTLIAAASKNYSKAIAHLITQGADVNYNDNNNITPLMAAVKEQADSALIQLLLDVGADPHLKDGNRCSVLDYMYWAYLGHPEKLEIKQILQNAMHSTSK